jgi:hypothetical protein
MPNNPRTRALRLLQGFWSTRTFPDSYRVEVTISPCTVRCSRWLGPLSTHVRTLKQHSPDAEPFPLGALDRFSRQAGRQLHRPLTRFQGAGLHGLRCFAHRAAPIRGAVAVLVADHRCARSA